MKELLRNELIKTREKFMNLKDYEKYLSFFLLVDLNVKDRKNAEIVFKSFALTKNEDLVKLGENTRKNILIKEFIDLVKYAEEKYMFQFSFEIGEFLSCIYGIEDTDFELFVFMLENLIENERYDLISSGNFGFVVAETIF